MSLADAEQFVQHIHDQLGRWPVVYTGLWYINQICYDNQTTLLSNCPLWVASYRSAPVVPPQWTTWTLWQFTNGQNGPEPHKLNGIGPCDRNWFNGTLQALMAFWGMA